MIVEFGHFALILATCVALIQGVLPLAGTANDHQRWQALARPTAIVQFVLIAFSFAVLANAALSDDFSIKYVAQHSNSLLPSQYKFASVWGGHEGSLLLWVLMLSGWTVAVALFSRSLPLAMVARVIGILGLVSTGFLTQGWSFIRPCCTWAMWVFLWPLLSRWLHCCRVDWMRLGRAGHVLGLWWRGSS